MTGRRRERLYTHRPIASTESLAKALGIGHDVLLDVAERAERLRVPGKREKKRDGTERVTHDALPPLKTVHDRIVRVLFSNVVYAPWLMGSLPASPGRSRGVPSHVAAHAGCATLVGEDVLDFFPSIPARTVHRMWTDTFGFSSEVAELLTSLTTYRGEVPQGWKTSSYLANLALDPYENELVDWCAGRGCSYSRYVDDVNVSVCRALSTAEKTELVARIYAMFHRAGVRPKRSKHEIAGPGRRKRVTGQNVDRARPSLPKPVRAKIRTAVFQCERTPADERRRPEYRTLWESARGRVAYLAQRHVRLAAGLRRRLDAVAPGGEEGR